MKAAWFADTFYYLALINPRDAAHKKAVAFSRDKSASLITSAWVLQEVADGLAPPPNRAVVMRLLQALDRDSETTILGPDHSTWRQGLHLYRSRPDKSWSLTDCISFEIMRERGINDALTADHHFEQAGFNVLLRA